MGEHRKKFKVTVNTVLDYKGLKKNFRAVSLCVLKTVSARENSAQRPTVNPLTPELNPFAQRSLTRHFTGDFAS
jgi:hypothetical protein